MPSQINITAHTKHFCHPCEHLKHEHVIYGHDFVRGDWVCHHPEANDFGPLPDDPHLAAKLGEMRARIRDYGRMISKHEDIQPEWCPLRKPLTGKPQ